MPCCAAILRHQAGVGDPVYLDQDQHRAAARCLAGTGAQNGGQTALTVGHPCAGYDAPWRVNRLLVGLNRAGRNAQQHIERADADYAGEQGYQAEQGEPAPAGIGEGEESDQQGE